MFTAPLARSSPRDEEEAAPQRTDPAPTPTPSPFRSARLVSAAEAAAPGMYQSPRRLCSALLLRDAPGLRRSLAPGPRRPLAPPVLRPRPASPRLQAAASGAGRSRPGTGKSGSQRGMNGQPAAGAGPRAWLRRRVGEEALRRSGCRVRYLYLIYLIPGGHRDPLPSPRWSHVLLRFTPGCRAVTFRLPRLLRDIFMRGENVKK